MDYYLFILIHYYDVYDDDGGVYGVYEKISFLIYVFLLSFQIILTLNSKILIKYVIPSSFSLKDYSE